MTMAGRKTQFGMGDLVVQGLIAGYVYAIILSASSIAVCEVKNKSDCAQVWGQGFSLATGLVTTFLAYLVQPGQGSPSPTNKREDPNASS
jgi:hypothetical protein